MPRKAATLSHCTISFASAKSQLRDGWYSSSGCRGVAGRQQYARETFELGVIRGMERRLSAILAADVVGYSRLMGANEVGTLTSLKCHRAELIDPTIAEHQGRIVKLTGDGMLIEFPSVVNAVECATEIQRDMPVRN